MPAWDDDAMITCLDDLLAALGIAKAEDLVGALIDWVEVDDLWVELHELETSVIFVFYGSNVGTGLSYPFRLGDLYEAVDEAESEMYRKLALETQSEEDAEDLDPESKARRKATAKKKPAISRSEGPPE